MKRRFALAIGTLALSYLGGFAYADEVIRQQPLEAVTTSHAGHSGAADATKSPSTHSAIAPYQSETCLPLECHGKQGSGFSFNAGAGVYYIQPHWETNPAFTATTLDVNGVLQVRQQDFTYDYEFAPLVWLGASDCNGFGVRGRYWWYEQSANISLTNEGTVIDSAAPLGLQNASVTPGDVLTFDSDLEIRVYDLEATQVFNSCQWNILLAGGVRYAHISQSYNHSETPAAGINVDAIFSGHNFKGIGPTVAIEVRRCFGTSGLAVYGTARGSVLFGTGRQEAAQIIDDVFAVFAASARDDVLPITELEVGAEYSVGLGKGRFFAQAGMVGQIWHGAGNAAANDLIPVLVDPEVSDNNTNLGLFGLRLAVGINY